METIRTALEQLQQDSDNAEAWQALETGVEKHAAKRLSKIRELFATARAAHSERHEWWAVARLLALEVAATPESAPELLELMREYGTIQLQRLYDDGEAGRVFAALLEHDPKDSVVKELLAESEERAGNWEKLAARYLSEAEGASDDVYKSSMLMRVAEMELRFGGDSVEPDLIEKRLHEACQLDPDNQGACEMYEYLCRRSEDWQELASLFEAVLPRVTSASTKVLFGVKAARIAAHRLSNNERAANAYQQVLEAAPAHGEASSFLAEYHAQRGAWQELVHVYERRLQGEGENSPEQLGDMLQIALLYFRKLGQPAAAEPWFERVRKLDPGNAAMLEFFREYLAQTGDSARLQAVLQNAERALPAGSDKKAVTQALSDLKDGEKGAQQSIEGLKAQLRQDPNNAEIRAQLKKLYREAGSHNALVELLRQQLERTPTENRDERLAVLREVADVYRQHLPGDPALVSVLSQISAIDPEDAATLRELSAAYERLARWRDLLSCQQKLAEVTTDEEEKATLWRAVAARWLDQFSNVQNATQAYEALLAVRPTDEEARAKLQDLYTKRRAWQPLYELWAAQAREDRPIPERVALLKQMAQLCAERISRAQEAMDLYKQIVELDPSQIEILEALERQAERAKDWPTLAQALERRIEATDSSEARVALLHKLGAVCSDQLHDNDRALDVWRRVVELQPSHTRALRFLREAYLERKDFDALEALYVSQNDFEGLAEVLGHAAEKTDDAKLKVDLSYRAARVYADMLGQPARALRSYERVLATDPSDVKAAQALIPICEQEEKWARLPALYDVLITASSDANEQLAYLKKVVQVTGGQLGDRMGSLTYARRAFEVMPDDAEGLVAFEKAAASAGRWESFAESLNARLEQLLAEEPAAEAPADNRGKKKKKDKRGGERTPQPPAVSNPQTREITLRLAHVYDAHLQQADRASELLKAQLSKEPSDQEVAARLEGILRREGKRDDLRWVLQLRVDQAASDDARTRLLAEWAQLEEDVFKDAAQASELHGRVLEIDAGNITALRARSRLLLSNGDHAVAAQALERSLGSLSGLERAEIEVLLAQLYLDHLSQPEQALEHAIGTLKFGSHDTRAIAVLERLVQVDATRERAAQVLASEYAEVGDARHEVEALQAMLSATKDAEERLSLLARLVSIQEQKLDSVNAAFDTLLRAVREFPERMELWDQAEEVAARAGRAGELSEAFRETLSRLQGRDLEVEICERAARLHQEKLGDPGGAVPYLERILKRDPSNSGAFAQLKHVLTAEERWAELAGLYELVIAEETLPAIQIELLLEVALLCEEITEDLPGAVRYYERILSLDPLHDVASRALDRLYVRLSKDQELAALLERRIPETTGGEQAELQTRLAALFIDKLHRPSDAVAHLQAVLEGQPNDAAARELAERLLQIGSLREAAVEMLERVYETRDEPRDLVRVLEVRLALLQEQGADRPDESEHAIYRDTLRRVAVLKDSRLHDDAGAFAAFARFVPLDPLDFEAKNTLGEIAARLGNFAELSRVYERTEAVLEDPEAKAQMLMATAQLCEERLQDSERAQALYQRVLALREHTPDLAGQAARALDRIYAGLGRDVELSQVLRAEIDLELVQEVKAALQARLANVFETRLSQIDQAIEVWRERLEADSTDDEALQALDRLYETTGRWSELVPILEQRQEQATDTAAQRALAVRRAQVLSDKLDKLEEAIGAWEGILEAFGNEASARDALEDLYRKAQRWPDLAESYLAHAEVVDNDAGRIELWRKLGDLRAGPLGSPESALEAYREGLALDARHVGIREALHTLLANDDALVRRETAAVLRALYETEHDSARLLGVLEVQIAATEDPLDKVEVLQLAMRVADTNLHDVQRALGYAQQAVREGAGHVDLRDWFGELDRLSGAAGERASQVSLLCGVVERIFDGDLKYDVTLKIALLARDELGQLELSRDYFEQASKLDPSRVEPLLALQALYEKQASWQDVLRILERRIEVSSDDAERQQLLFKKASLLASELAEANAAIESYEAIILERLDPEAVKALEGLYRSQDRFSDLVSLLERQLDANPAGEADYRVKIADVLADKLSDPDRALDEVEAALKVSPRHSPATAFLQRIVEAPEGDPQQRARAAQLLEPIYLATADYDHVMKTLAIRLEVLDDPSERRALLLQLAKLHEEQKEDYRAALETLAKLFHEDISDQTVVGELERLARVADAKPRLAEIFSAELADTDLQDSATAALARRTGELLAEQGQDERALTFLERALEFEPDSSELFQLVDQTLERLGKHRARVDLYSKMLEQRYEPSERLQLLHAIASMERGSLREPARAIDAYVQVLDIDERDRIALDALSELYRETERYPDLADHYLRRAELAETPAEQAEQRMLLARVARTRLGDTGRAIDQLEEVTRIVPQHAAAIADLEALRDTGEHRERVIDILRPIYEASDSWQRLISLNEDRLSITEDPIDRLAILRDNAQLWEERGHAPEPARVVLGGALDLDPNDNEVRASYQRLVAQTGAWAELAQRYEKLLDGPDLVERVEYLQVLGEAYDRHLRDPRSALRAAQRLLEIERGQIEYVDRVEQLAFLLGDWRALVSALEVKVDLQLEDSERASTWGQVAEIQRDMLDDMSAAVEAGERTLDFEPNNLHWLDFVIGLHQRHDQPQRLVELCQQRLERSEPGDDERRYELALLMADTYQHKLTDPSAAVEELEKALQIRPGDAAALERLAAIHRAQENWSDYLATLALLAEGAPQVSDKIRFIKERAQVQVAQLSDPEEALASHREVLQLSPADAESIAAAVTIGREQESLRIAVAELLVPLLDGASEREPAGRLVEVLELRLSAETDPAARVATLQAIARCKETPLGDRAGALQSLLSAVSEAPENAGLHQEIERLSGETNSWTDYAATLEERAGATFDSELGQQLWLRLGKVAEEKLGDAPRAILAYGRAIEQAGDRPDLLEALDRLHGRVEDFKAQADILERRLGFATAGAETGQLHLRLAQLHREQFSDPARALSALRLAIEHDPEQQQAIAELERLGELRELFEEASETLEAVYRRRGQTDRLASLYERRVGHAEDPAQRSEMRLRLAGVLEQELNDPSAAQRVLQQGLKEDPTDTGILTEIERLLGKTSDYRGAAAALEQAVTANPALEVSVARGLCLRAAQWYRDQTNDATAALGALFKALELDAANDEVLQGIERLQREQGDNKGLLQTLQRRARLQDDPIAREQLYRQLVDLGQSVDSAGVSLALRELLEQDPGNAWALQTLQERCEAEGDHKDAFALLERRIEISRDDQQLVALRHHAASIARDKLHKPAVALELYAQLFDVNANDEVASAALRALYAEAKQWKELRGVLERLIDIAPAAQRTALRLELAELCATKLDDADAAAESLRAVLADDASHAVAVTRLAALYEEQESYPQLSELWQQQAINADSAGDQAAAQQYRLKLAELQETHLKDRSQAIITLEEVVTRDGSQRVALQSLVRLLELEDRTADVARRLVELVELSPQAEAVELCGKLAAAQRAQGDVAAEIAALEKGLALDGSVAAFREQLLAAYEKAGHWEQLAALIASGADTVASNDEKVALLRQAAKVHADKRQDAASAAALLARASQIKPEDRELLLELCDAYNRSGRGDESVRVLEQIVQSFAGRRSKELVDVHRRLAAAYNSSGKSEQGIAELDKAFRIEPGNMAVLRDLGLMSMQVNDYKKAQQMFRALLLQKFEGHTPISKAEVFFHLAEIHERMGEKPKALQMAERAVQTDANLQPAQVLLQRLKA